MVKCNGYVRIFEEGTRLQTYSAKAGDITRKWYILDAANKPLGRVASEAARLLRGKHKPIFTPNMDTGDFVIVINAKDVILTGNKLNDKMYYHHSRYPGGLTSISYKHLLEDRPELAMEKAVKGMLPKGPLGRQMAKKMRVYAGAEHNQQAQKPEVWQF